jgi:hypothetical protein
MSKAESCQRLFGAQHVQAAFVAGQLIPDVLGPSSPPKRIRQGQQRHGLQGDIRRLKDRQGMSQVIRQVTVQPSHQSLRQSSCWAMSDPT